VTTRSATRPETGCSAPRASPHRDAARANHVGGRGDEFVLILAGLSKENVGTAAQKILESFVEPFLIDAHPIYVTTSIGIAMARATARTRRPS